MWYHWLVSSDSPLTMYFYPLPSDLQFTMTQDSIIFCLNWAPQNVSCYFLYKAVVLCSWTHRRAADNCISGVLEWSVRLRFSMWDADFKLMLLSWTSEICSQGLFMARTLFCSFCKGLRLDWNSGCQELVVWGEQQLFQLCNGIESNLPSRDDQSREKDIKIQE